MNKRNIKKLIESMQGKKKKKKRVGASQPVDSIFKDK